MSKTIVSIISEQTIPNYLFIKEVFLPGDTLMFISSRKMSNRIQWIKNTLCWNNVNSVDLILEREGDEENAEKMSAQIGRHLSKNEQYCVNLTGGTKFMALVMQNLFEKFNSQFYYIPYPKNQIISVSGFTISEITQRVGVEEYLSLYGENMQPAKKPTKPFQYTHKVLTLFLEKWKNEDFAVVDKLRKYRDDKKGCYIQSVEQKNNDEKKTRIENLKLFLDKIEFPYKDDHLERSDIQYLTGGWFEEYVFHYIQEYVHPNDIRLGVNIKKTNNDLDVVFTLGNKLFVIECKTGVEREMMLKEIVYKASALKSELLGLSAKSYIFALSEGNERWETAALNMGIKYCGRSYFENCLKLNCLLDSIVKTSFN